MKVIMLFNYLKAITTMSVTVTILSLILLILLLLILLLILLLLVTGILDGRPVHLHWSDQQ